MCVLVERREHERVTRALDRRGALLEGARRQHVQRARREPARHVAPRGRCGHHPGKREPGLGERQGARAGVDDHLDVARRALEQVGELLAERLEVVEQVCDVTGVRLLVAGAERGRLRLGPGHVAQSGTRIGGCPALRRQLEPDAVRAAAETLGAPA